MDILFTTQTPEEKEVIKLYHECKALVRKLKPSKRQGKYRAALTSPLGEKMLRVMVKNLN